jgi:hypothetical protein
MTIDEMIKYCEADNEMYAPVTEPGKRTPMDCIIAALRAGQEMRDEIDAWWEAGTSDTRGLYEASNAWDAATAEEVKE